MVCITVVCNDNHFVIVCFCCFHCILYTIVNSHTSFFNRLVDTCMPYHVTICIVYNDEIIFLCIDGFNQFVFHFVCAHFRLQIVSSNFWRRNQDAIFAFIRSFTSTIEEECHVCILFCFSNVQLCFVVLCQKFAQSILNVLFREQNMNTCERSIIRCHAIILQSRNCFHALFRHIFLSQYDCQLFRTVVAVVEEDNHITFFYRSIHSCIVDGFDELVSHLFIIRFLHSLNHICSLFALSFNQQIVCFFDTVPTFVTVHCIETTYNRSDCTCRLSAMCSQLFDETFTTLRVCITTIHETMDKRILQSIFFSNVTQLKQVFQR